MKNPKPEGLFREAFLGVWIPFFAFHQSDLMKNHSLMVKFGSKKSTVT